MPLDLHSDHIGSLLRPQALLDAREAHDQGRLSDEALRTEEDRAILDALKMQRQSGIGICTDGEFRRMTWMSGMAQVLDGVVNMDSRRFPPNAWKGSGAEVANAEVPMPTMAANGPIRLKARFTGTETAFLKAHAPGPWKITMPSPTIQISMFDREASRAAYPTQQDLLDAIVKVYQDEVDGQIEDGAAYIQVDSLRYAQVIGGFTPMGEDLKDTDAVVGQVIASDNAVLSRARAKGVTTGVHICRGNHRSAWAMSGSYDAVAERLLNEVETDRFLLEYDDERSGTFEPLRFTPKGKTVVLGLVSSKLGPPEDPDELRRRVDEAAKYVPLEQLALSPQCGFASTFRGNLLSQDDQKRKLELVADTARKIWG